MAKYEVLRNAIKKVPVGEQVELTEDEAKARGPKYVKKVGAKAAPKKEDKGTPAKAEDKGTPKKASNKAAK